jgi:hypothetical protein
MNDALRETEKKYCSRALIAAVIIGFVLILAGLKPMGKGLVLGTVFSIINFILIGETLSFRMADSTKKSSLRALFSLLFRYLLLAVPLVAAIKYDQFDLFGVMGGIFMVQIMILTDHVSVYLLKGRVIHGRLR